MFKKWLCLLLALMLCATALAEGVVVSDGEEGEAMPAEVGAELSLNSLADELGRMEETLADEEGDAASPVQPEVAAPEEETQEEETPAEPTLKLSASKLTIGVKESCEILKATLKPEGTGQTVTWSSDDKKIAKVNAKTGVITGVKVGTTTVRAKTSGGLEKTCKITVKKAPSKVTLDKAKLTLSVGDSYTLSATLPSKTGSTLTYSTNKKKVAAVDALSGTITALAPGSATITVKTFNKKKATCKVTVVAAPDQVLLPEKLTIAENENKTIEASALDADGNATVASYTYSAENGTGAVIVDPKTGAVTGVSRGTAYIYVTTHNGVTTHLSDGERVQTVCVVNVVEGPKQVGLAADSVTIGVKQSYALNPVLLAEDGTEMSGKYTVASSASKKLSVSSKGVIKGIKKGTYTVTVTAYNGVKASCKVKVVSAPSKVTLSPKKPVLGLGQTQKLGVTFPKNTMASVTFSSSAKDVAAVDAEGNVTGLKEGTAVIKVRTHNSKTAKVTVTVEKGPDFISLNGDYVLEYDELTSSYRVVYTKTLEEGKTFQITYENEYLTYGSIASYESDNLEVAKVSSKGVVTALEPGTANIVVRSTSGAEATLRVTVPGIPPAKLAFNAQSAEVQVGRVVAAPTLRGSNIEAATLAQATYTSSNKKIFTVVWSEAENRWELTGVKAGTATLTATAGKAKAQIQVKVSKAAKATSIRFENSLVYMRVGESFAPRVLDEYDAEVAVTLSSGDESVAAVGDGALTAVGEGTAVIEATCGSLSATMTVVIQAGEATVSLDTESLVLGVGQRYALKAQVNGDGGSSKLSYTSSKTSVATVSASGTIIARGTGSATITVEEAGGASATCSVVVRPAPTMLSVTPGSVSARLKKQGVQLEWSFGASDQVGTVSFASSDESIASVSETGYVTFNGVGATTIQAVTHNGLTAVVSVTVLPDSEESDTTTYRLFAAYNYFNSKLGSEYLPFSKNNGKSVAGVFGKSSIGGEGYSTKVMGNPSKTQLLTGISSFFSSADDNDVSIVYLCAHGHNTKSLYKNYRMSFPGYSSNNSNPNYYMTATEIFNCVKRIRGSVVLILDSCYSGTFIEDMKGKLDGENGRIAVVMAASNTRATFYNTSNTSKAVDFFTFFLLQGLGYNEKEGWWNGNSKASKGSYPGYLAADKNGGNGDGLVTLGEFYDYAAKCIAVNIPVYMKKSYYWGDKKEVQQPRFYAGALRNLVIYQPN